MVRVQPSAVASEIFDPEIAVIVTPPMPGPPRSPNPPGPPMPGPPPPLPFGALVLGAAELVAPAARIPDGDAVAITARMATAMSAAAAIPVRPMRSMLTGRGCSVTAALIGSTGLFH